MMFPFSSSTPAGNGKIAQQIREIRRAVLRNRIMPGTGVETITTNYGTAIKSTPKTGGGGSGGEAVWL